MVVSVVESGESSRCEEMSPPTLYFLDVSPPVRGVVLVAKALGVELDIKPLNLAAGEHLTPEFLKVSQRQRTSESRGWFL